VKLAITMTRLRMHGVVPSLLHEFGCHGANHRVKIAFLPLYIIYMRKCFDGETIDLNILTDLCCHVYE
jgi:hypothetical protein